MKTLSIEWRHLDVAGSTCERCDDTGGEVRKAVELLNRECAAQGYSFELVETLLEADALEESNTILIDGLPIEKILPESRRSDSECHSCSDLVGEAVSCRTLEFAGKSHESVPASIIRAAACEMARCCRTSCC